MPAAFVPSVLRRAWPLVLAALAPPAFALAPEALLEAVHAPQDAIVKAWPGVEGRTLVAWTQAQGDLDNAAGEPVDLGLTVLVADTATGRVLQRYHDDAAYTSDAIAFQGISLDTADYALRPGVRAFGVRSSGVHEGCGSLEQTDLRLFEVRGDQLVPVLALPMSTHSAMCDCGGSSDMERTIEIGRGMHAGHADLLLHERRAEVDEGPSGGPCPTRRRRSARTVVLRFYGESYAVPDGLD